MKKIDWNAEKNQRLRHERSITFEDVLFALQSGGLLDDVVHPNQDKYPQQRVLVVKINDYAWLVPYVESETGIFLKTIIPSRKVTRQYLGGEHD